MHRRIVILLLLAMLSSGRPESMARGEVIDKIAAVVNGRIITLSDMRLEHDIQQVLGDPPETNEELLKSMVDRALLEEEMSQFPSLDVSDDEVDDRMKEIPDLRGIAPSAVRNAIVHKLQRRKYLELRYRQFIVVSSEEIEQEYETAFVPEAKKRGIPVPDLKTIEENLRMILSEKKVSQEVEESLRDLHARGNVEVFF
jgi:parvulin-like peptidyl-prolyl isomerase